MNIQKRIYTDIHNPQILVNLILAEIIRRETFGRVLNLNPKELLGENFYGVVNSEQEFIDDQMNTFARHTVAVVGNPVTAESKAF